MEAQQTKCRGSVASGWGYGNKYINEMVQWAPVPVMNLQCDLYHPMQAIVDLMTI